MPKITKFVRPDGQTIDIIPFQWGEDDEDVDDIAFDRLPEPIQSILQARLEFSLGWYCEHNEHLLDLKTLNKNNDIQFRLYQFYKNYIRKTTSNIGAVVDFNQFMENMTKAKPAFDPNAATSSTTQATTNASEPSTSKQQST